MAHLLLWANNSLYGIQPTLTCTTLNTKFYKSITARYFWGRKGHIQLDDCFVLSQLVNISVEQPPHPDCPMVE